MFTCNSVIHEFHQHDSVTHVICINTDRPHEI